MKYITAEELVAINQTVIRLSGGSHGLREPGMLESIALKPQTEFSGQELYPDIFLKAAVIYEALVNYRVFIDGNKRSGFASFASMVRFLGLNGYDLIISDKEIVNYTVYVATNNPDLADIAIWIKTHSQKTKSK